MSGEYDDLKRRMDGAIAAFKHDLASLRTGRASSNLLDADPGAGLWHHHADQPGGERHGAGAAHDLGVGLGQVDGRRRRPRHPRIQSGFNPIVDGTNLRIPLPELNEQRRKELVKIAHNYAENARVAVRHVRRDGMDHLKKAEKDGDISEDDQRERPIGSRS